MPRKNSHDANVVTALLQQQSWWKGWSLQVIENCSHADVIATLQRSLVFLSFGHPEGFGLPVAEAMACGCAVVGYSGLGGRELFDLAAGYGLGVPVELGDWLGCVQGVERINHALRHPARTMSPCSSRPWRLLCSSATRSTRCSAALLRPSLSWDSSSLSGVIARCQVLLSVEVERRNATGSAAQLSASAAA